VVAAVRLGAPGRAVSFAVPTGNFGNVLAGWAAWKCGLPIDRLVVGTNSNDILFRFFETGEMKMAAVEPTLSPSMDIQVSSNFERLLFDMLGGDGAAVRQWIDDFRQTGAVSVDDARLAAAREKFVAARLDDAGTRRVIREIYETTGELLDPHSAIGVDAARQCRGDSAVPMIALATAHPAKFPDAVEAATGVHPALPERMAGLFDRVERYDTLANDIGAVQDYVRRTVGAGGVA
jgi:threonine synthase